MKSNPRYKYDTKRLAEVYDKALSELEKELTELLAVSSDSTQIASKEQVIQLLARRLLELNGEVEPVIAELIAERYNLSLQQFAESTGIDVGFQFGLHTDTKIQMWVSDTMTDLLKATDNMKQSCVAIIEEVAAESLQLSAAKHSSRENMVAELLDKLNTQAIQKRLRENGFIGIVDKAGKKWSLDTYAEMLVSTKIEQIDSETTKSQGLLNGIDLAVISRHGATDECALWEDTVISMNGLTEGFPTYAEVKATGQCFHPRCQHHLQPVRNTELISDRVMQNHTARLSENMRAIQKAKEKK